MILWAFSRSLWTRSPLPLLPWGAPPFAVGGTIWGGGAGVVCSVVVGAGSAGA